MHFEARANIEKNRLYIKLEGFFSDEVARNAAETIFAEIDKLQPGFAVINDVSNFKPGTPTGAKEIVRVQTYEQEHGVGRIVRIVGQEVIGKMQFERMSKETDIKVEFATSLEEAERLLDQ
jgi:hypothetical protein